MTKAVDELNWLSAAELGSLYREHQISPVDVVEASFRRIADVNPGLNAFCALDHDRALESARRSKERFAVRAPLGSLDGVPVAIKDLTPTAGLRTAKGSLIFADHVPTVDAVVVERLKAAGAIVVAKTTTSEFANASVTQSPLTGSTRNPWDASRTSGGSSGGSAVAVATGCVPLAEGSDMGGSVRIPACFCGVVGLKPALGRIPFGLLPNLYDATAHHGPIARNVSDAAMFLRTTAGPDDRDPLSLPPDPGLDRPLGPDLRGIRIALSTDLGFQSVEQDVVENTVEATARLVAAGAIVETIELGLSPAIYDAGYKLFAALTYRYYGAYEEQHSALLDPTLRRFFEIAKTLSADDLLETQVVASREWSHMATVFEAYSALVCPTMPRTATPLGMTEFDYAGQDEKGRTICFDMTFPFNMFGRLPAITIPSGLGRDGLPTGLQIVARRHDEHTALSLAHALHDEALWNTRLKALGSWGNDDATPPTNRD